MFTTLLEFVQSRLPEAGTTLSEVDQQHTNRLITAALLVEMMRADFQEGQEERSAIILSMKQVFELDDDETAELLLQAELKAKQATSLYEFTREVNRTHNEARKIQIVELLWEVAYADGHLDKYEEHLVRRVADLIHVPHSEFIQAKHRVQERSVEDT